MLAAVVVNWIMEVQKGTEDPVCGEMVKSTVEINSCFSATDARDGTHGLRVPHPGILFKPPGRAKGMWPNPWLGNNHQKQQ